MTTRDRGRRRLGAPDKAKRQDQSPLHEASLSAPSPDVNTGTGR
jgi:hypothetical protein